VSSDEYKKDDGVADVPGMAEVRKPELAPKQTISARLVKVNYSKPCLENKSDVEEYIIILKRALLNEIDTGKQIQV
jgi:hypothetical protein